MALPSTLISDDSARTLLESLNWRILDSDHLNKFWKNRWEQPLVTSFLDPWPEWQEALNDDSADMDIIETAQNLEIIHEDNQALRHTEFYDLSPGDFSALRPTNNRIALRSSYKRLYRDICVLGRSAVVTGQPTSGKTYFLYYCLMQRLALGKPVILSASSSEWLLFSRWGVRKNADLRTSLNDDTKIAYRMLLPPETWALIDGDARPRGQDMEHNLSAGYLDITTVLVSLPYAGHYDKWLRSPIPPLLRVIEPANYEEIVNGCRLFTGVPSDTVEPRSAFERLLYFMTIFGHAEGECLRSFTTSSEAAVNMLRREIGRIKFSVLQRIFASLTGTDQAVSDIPIEGLFYLDSEARYQRAVSMVAIVTPRHALLASDNDSLGLDIASTWILRELFREFLIQNEKHIQEFINLCTRHSHTKALAGYFFEEVIHNILANARADWQDRCILTEFFPCGKTAHIAMNPLPLRRGHIFRKRTVVSYKGVPPDFDPRTYKQPFAKNNPTFDSILHAADYDAPADEKPDPEHKPKQSPPSSPSTRKTRFSNQSTGLKKRSKRPPSPPPSPFRRTELSTSSSPAKGKGVDRAMAPPSLPLHRSSAPIPEPSTFATGRSISSFDPRAESPDGGFSNAGSSRAPSEVSAAMSDSGMSSADEPPGSTVSGSDVMTVRGHSPFATRSVIERPKPPASVSSVLGRRKRRAASTADGRPTKVARTEVPHVERHYVAMQMTVGKRHTWNEKGFKLLEKSFREVGNWHFVIVTHKRSDLNLDALRDELRAEEPGRTFAQYYRWYHLAVDLTKTPWDDIEFEDEYEDEEESVVEGESQDGDFVEHGE